MVTHSVVGSETHHRVCGMEYVEEAFADSCGEDVILHTVVSRPDPSQCQENSQRGAHAEEIFYLQHREQGKYNISEQKTLPPERLNSSYRVVHWLVTENYGCIEPVCTHVYENEHVH